MGESKPNIVDAIQDIRDSESERTEFTNQLFDLAMGYEKADGRLNRRLIPLIAQTAFSGLIHSDIFRKTQALKGEYNVIEGTDGTGKSTQVELLNRRFEDLGFEVKQFHEPDGVEIAGKIRTVIKNGNLERLPFTNVLLLSAARRENWIQEGRGVLERGGRLSSARDDTSTDVYQGEGEGVPIWLIQLLTRVSTDRNYTNPTHKIVLDIDDEVIRQERIASRGELSNPDTFESRGDEFQRAVINGYRKVAKRKKLPIISAVGSLEAIHEEIWEIVK